MTPKGYFKYWRKLENWPWRNKPHYFSVWLRCLELATHTERKTRLGQTNKVIELKPGQFVSGRDAISKWTGVKPTTVLKILNTLKRDNQIDIESSPHGSVFTVIKWDEYQSRDNESDNGVTTEGQRSDTTQECKNERSNTNVPYSENFERWYRHYPLKKGKQAAFNAWKKLGHSRPPIDDLIAAVEKQQKWDEWKRDGFIPHPATWLNQKRWEDEPKQKNKNHWIDDIEEAD